MTRDRKVQLVEVHGNDGTLHSTAAKRVVKRMHPGATIIDARPSGERCKHGMIVWAVEYEAAGA